MRTTVNLGERALAICRRKAEGRGVSLGEVITEAILQAYSPRPAEPSPATSRFELPVSGRGGLLPGVDLDRWAG